jgi:hypothetical protein
LATLTAPRVKTAASAPSSGAAIPGPPLEETAEPSERINSILSDPSHNEGQT